MTTQSAQQKVTVSARGILVETIIEKPTIFKDSSQWFTLHDLRESLIHPFDVERMYASYPSRVEAWQQMQAAVRSIPWIEWVGDGAEVKFRVTAYPQTLPKDYNDALAEIRVLRGAVGKWKDVALLLSDLTDSNNGLTLSLEKNESILRKAMCLAFYYRSQVLELRKSRNMEIDDIDPNPMLLEAIEANPSSFAEVKTLQKAFLLLTDAALQDAVDTVNTPN